MFTHTNIDEWCKMVSIKGKLTRGNEPAVVSMMRGYQPEGKMDVRGMSLRGIHHEGNDPEGNGRAGMSLRGIHHEENEPEGEMNVRGMSQRKWVMRRNQPAGIDLRGTIQRVGKR